MEVWFKIPLLALGSIIVLFILCKLMGNKQMSQLTLFDYIIGITIGSIAAEMATSLEDNFIEPLLAMIVYATVSILISLISCRSLHFRSFMEGKTYILYDNGILYKRNFKKAKLDINEFLMQCRIAGYFNLSQLQTAILESNGHISLLPLSSSKPLTAGDMNINLNQEKIILDLILDGRVLIENLAKAGHSQDWLIEESKKQGFGNIKDIFLATYDGENLSIYKTKKEY